MPNHSAPLEHGVRKSLCVCACTLVGVCVSFGQLFKVESCPRQSRLSGRRQADNGGASVRQGLHLKVTHTYTHTRTYTCAHTGSCVYKQAQYISTWNAHITAHTTYFFCPCVVSIYHFCIYLKAFPRSLFIFSSPSLPLFLFPTVFPIALYFSCSLPPLPLFAHVISPFNFTYLELAADSLKYPAVHLR